MSSVQHESNSSAKIKFIEKNKDVFSGFGRLPDPCTLPLRETNPNIFYPTRRIPDSLFKRLQAELDRLEARQAIVKVDKISETACVNNVVVEKPNGK